MTCILAQVTDTHLLASPQDTYRGWPTWASCRAVLAAVAQDRPDLLLLTGDLSQDGSRASYEHLRDLVEPLGIPTYVLPGNHDNPAALAAVFPGGNLCTTPLVTAGRWAILLLDSTVPGEVYGDLSLDQLTALDATLTQTAGRPTLIALHHPVLPIGSPWIDATRLRPAGAFVELLAAHPHVKVVLAGHVHQESQAMNQGVAHYTTPATGLQFKPQTEQFCLDTQAPGYRLLYLEADGQHRTTVRRVQEAGEFAHV
ncbi:MAG: phosphodiesterase [Gloeomargaritaceae cyanobacterium C42_A2020_066]|nr:phosphodiesterase [Gloeomargaritaceae cyanobacterium C42_A2020_066]